ncbi:hypothetical protein KP509_02G062900 [Ceratopteris richardii]|uniref:IST1-like protein n=1 Tax=Ceratopteris richardii TaxID=49495 RepID=A0A8T2VHY5_CERRI|nr:hypothetical protein KP509_02G062900 [Ceratopteris richardii]
MFFKLFRRLRELLRLSPKLDEFKECQNLLGHTISRCITHKKKAEAKMVQLRKDVAQLVHMGQTDRALATVSIIIQDKSTVSVYGLIQSYCELLIGEVHTLLKQRLCPISCQTAVASLIYATSRCSANMHELPRLTRIFTKRFGKSFVEAATNNEPNSAVSPELVEALSRREPTLDSKRELIKEIAPDFAVDI